MIAQEILAHDDGIPLEKGHADHEGNGSCASQPCGFGVYKEAVAVVEVGEAGVLGENGRCPPIYPLPAI